MHCDGDAKPYRLADVCFEVCPHWTTVYAAYDEPFEKLKNVKPNKLELDESFHLDLRWWRTFLAQWNGVASFLTVDWQNASVLHLFTDAAGGSGYGAVLISNGFSVRGLITFPASRQLPGWN